MQMMLSGNLSNWSVADLLQMMRVTGKTAALRIEGTRAGVIHFNDGKLAGAALAGQRPPSELDQLRRSTIDALVRPDRSDRGIVFRSLTGV